MSACDFFAEHFDSHSHAAATNRTILLETELDLMHCCHPKKKMSRPREFFFADPFNEKIKAPANRETGALGSSSTDLSEGSSVW